MAESLGKMKFQTEEKPIFINKECFQETYFDEFMELVSDSDNMVRLRAFEAAGKLIQ